MTAVSRLAELGLATALFETVSFLQNSSGLSLKQLSRSHEVVWTAHSVSLGICF